MKVLTVIGARPQFIKAAPVSGKQRKHAQARFKPDGLLQPAQPSSSPPAARRQQAGRLEY